MLIGRKRKEKARKSSEKTAELQTAETKETAKAENRQAGTCPQCGAEVDNGHAFCPSCGANVERARKKAEARSKRKSKRKVKKEVERIVGPGAAQCTNDLAGFRLLFSDGVCETAEGVFCKTMAFGDISYEHERDDVQQEIFKNFSLVHAAFPPGTCYQINLVNVPHKRRGVERYLPETGADAALARSYNEIIAERQRHGRVEFDRDNYITFSVEADDDRSAARKLATLEEAAAIAFTRLSCRTRALDGMEKAALVKRLLCGPEDPLLLDYARLANTRREHVRDYVVPAWAAYPPTEAIARKMIALPGRIAKSFLIRDFGSDLSDQAIRTIRALPIPMNISLLFRPQPKAETVKTILNNIDVVQAEMLDYSRSIAKSGGDPTLMPPALENREAASREQLDFIQEYDQTESWFQGTITVWADDEEKMAVYTDMIMSEKGNWTIDIVDLPLRQEEALTGALPLATPRLDDCYRSLSTAEGAAMIPFVSQTVHDDPATSLMVGVDRASGDSILVDLNRTKSPHGWLFGITGGGKSMQLNSMLSYSLLQHPRTHTDEVTRRDVSPDPLCPQWHVFDFHREYVELARGFDGEVSSFGPGHESCLNPMDMSDSACGLTLQEVRANADFFLALFESLMDQRVLQDEKSLLDRCLQEVYAPHLGTDGRPTLADLYTRLRETSRETAEGGERTRAAAIAERLADSLELYVTGSMNSFAHETNVDISPHLNVYDMSELGVSMQTLGMLSALQHVRKCAFANHSAGKQTYVVVEECQKLFENEAAVRVLDALFSEMRKYGLHVICVTQLPKKVLEHPRAVYLFENSSLFVLMPQQVENADLMTDKFKLSASQAEALSLNADTGTGLVIADGVKVKFRNYIPHGTLCYEFWNTDSDKGEKAM